MEERVDMTFTIPRLAGDLIKDMAGHLELDGMDGAYLTLFAAKLMCIGHKMSDEKIEVLLKQCDENSDFLIKNRKHLTVERVEIQPVGEVDRPQL